MVFVFPSFALLVINTEMISKRECNSNNYNMYSIMCMRHSMYMYLLYTHTYSYILYTSHFSTRGARLLYHNSCCDIAWQSLLILLRRIKISHKINLCAIANMIKQTVCTYSSTNALPFKS